jgi:hypothetical protein
MDLRGWALSLNYLLTDYCTFFDEPLLNYVVRSRHEITNPISAKMAE